MGLALLIIGLILGVGSCAYLIYRLVQFCKRHTPGIEHPKMEGTEKIVFMALVLAQGLFTIISSYGIIATNGWVLNAGEHAMLIFGSYMFGSGFSLLLSSFVLYYWRPDFDEKQRKMSRILTFVAIPFVVIGLVLFTEGFANHMSYPLPNGISFTEGIMYPDQHYSGFAIKFYGVIIVCGALICYLITNHYCYKKYGKHGLIDGLFIFAFLMGIVGARLWYCLILKKDVYLADPGRILLINEGGLAIQGGALLGIAAGVSFVLIFRKYMDLRFVMDVAIPTILIAQCLGRWGNFFNHEVYGFEVTRESLWYLPTIVKNNMFFYSKSFGKEAYWLPLFFIEGTINLAGFFIIRFFFGKVCKCHLGLGYQSSLYLIWYGVVRSLLEPLRNGNSDVGSTSEGDFFAQSIVVSYVMIGLGVALLAFFIVLHYVRMKKGLENKIGERV